MTWWLECCIHGRKAVSSIPGLSTVVYLCTNHFLTHRCSPLKWQGVLVEYQCCPLLLTSSHTWSSIVSWMFRFACDEIAPHHYHHYHHKHTRTYIHTAKSLAKDWYLAPGYTYTILLYGLLVAITMSTYHLFVSPFSLLLFPSSLYLSIQVDN